MNVKKYLEQLIGDIQTATRCRLEVCAMQVEDAIDILVWERQVEKVQIQAFDEWCTIKQTQLPPNTNLNDQQISLLVEQLKLLLNAYNCPIIFQFHVPERLQYQVIRANFNQQVPTIKVRHFTFSFCEEEACRKECILGTEYCHCLFFDDFFDKFAHTNEATEEIDLDNDPYKQYMLKKRYGDQWMDELLPKDSEPWEKEDDIGDIENSPN